ncbi:hypothetical protein B0H14DRAFT_496065 [Mycena olivaceomarginata]|nr:hypothetical protein B0H14DRAFT_496065 [Mycena olivaceomarginata]
MDGIPHHAEVSDPPSEAARVIRRSDPHVFTGLQHEGREHIIDQEDVHQQRMKRHCGELHTGDLLHDLLASSFVPLTKNVTAKMEYVDQAAEFFSCFRDYEVEWDLKVEGLPFSERKAIYGSTPNARRKEVDWRFQRFRFPHVRFEWHVETRYSEVAALIRRGKLDDETTIKFSWTAWTRNYAASAVIAVGTCEDVLTLVALPESQPLTVPQPATIAQPVAGAQPVTVAQPVAGVQPTGTAGAPSLALVISKRSFSVIKVIQPELMKPVPYRKQPPPAKRPNDLAIFSTSQTVIQWLQNIQEWTTFLVALSVLVTSLKPFVDKNHVAALILSVIAIIAAAISVLAVVIRRVLKRIEGSSAKYRND